MQKATNMDSIWKGCTESLFQGIFSIRPKTLQIFEAGPKADKGRGKKVVSSKVLSQVNRGPIITGC